MVTDIIVNSLEFYLHPTELRPQGAGVPRLRRLRGLGRDRPVAQHGGGAATFFWYNHLLDFLAFLCYLPYSKHSHVLTIAPQIVLPPLRADRRPAADPEHRGGRELRRRQAAAVHLEAAARLLHLHRVRALHRRLPGEPHRQAALPQARHRTTSASDGGAGAGLVRGASRATPAKARTAPENGHARAADRRRRLRADLGLRDLRRLHGGVPGLHRARADDHGHAPLPGDGRSPTCRRPRRQR